MAAQETPSDEALRHRALHAALAAIGAEGQVLLRAHPEAGSIQPPQVLEPLEWVQWDELDALRSRLELEGGISGLRRGPEAYLVERRHLHHLTAWRVAIARMPPTWRRVLRLSAKDAAELMARVGVELAARAARGVEGAALEPWLAPLGVERARQVAAALIQRRGEAPRPLAAAARLLFEDERARGTKGERLVVRVGRRALAASLSRVPEDLRYAAARAAWSNLLAVLERTVPLAVEGAADERALEELLAQALDACAGGER